MKQSIFPCAKINLGLNIVNKRPDGYHELETVFYPVAIHDKITIEELSNSNIPCNLNIEGHTIKGDIKNNLVFRAYHVVSEIHHIPPVNITLHKNIPMQAGMGGGSSDATYTIRLLNKMFHLKMTANKMRELAVTLGADCPFFVDAVPAYAEGIGEILHPIDLSLRDFCIAIIKPPVSISTREAFANIVPSKPEKNCKEIVKMPMESWKNILHNDFEKSIIPQYPELEIIKNKLYEVGSVYAGMSGSGSSLFGFFREPPIHLESLFPNCKTFILPSAISGPF